MEYSNIIDKFEDLSSNIEKMKAELVSFQEANTSLNYAADSLALICDELKEMVSHNREIFMMLSNSELRDLIVEFHNDVKELSDILLDNKDMHKD